MVHLECVSFADWEFQDSSFLGGLAIDSDGNAPYGNTPFSRLYGAQVACTELGDGCGGLTGYTWKGVLWYTLRRGKGFISSPNEEFSYLKPEKQCDGDDGKFCVIQNMFNILCH